MPAEVKVLVEGYTNADSMKGTGEEKTCSTITLIKDEGVAMVVDPGVLESSQILTDALKKEGLNAEDVNFVCITHSHIDHYRNIGMFPNAKVLEYYGLWSGGRVEDWHENFTPSIQILRTPGHDLTGLTLFVKTPEGIVAVCGDVFWKENYPENSRDDAYASNPGKLNASRQTVLKMADWIIPGHGGMYKNDPGKFTQEEESAEKEAGEKNFGVCKKCKRAMKNKKDSCRCRPYLCHHCCECDMDCDLCGCSHKI